MYKIRKIQFFKHPILGDLSLNFCDNDGRAVDTIIFAGENGTGKSTLLNELYNIASYNVKNPCKLEIEINGEIVNLDYFFQVNTLDNSKYIHVADGRGLNSYSNSEQFKQKYSFNGIYSDVDINFKANELSTVTSLNLDTVNASRKSTNDFPTEIKQLLIDIQALDDSDIARIVRENPNVSYNDVCVEERMRRFTAAFNKMFENLSYSNIINVNNHKSIIFHKFNKSVDIDNLSSGEKQIVYRGCFLLKDINAITGTFVFIDEPEISLHPIWQKKIMNFYKDIYTNDNGIQTSQIFAVTHSPFIVHNEYRKNDKVIVLSCNNNGDIIVKDKPEYFKCNSVEIVEDAFNVNNFISDDLIVYLAGRTDEQYFNKATEVFEYNIPFKLAI